MPRVVTTGQALPRDELGNRYETDSQGGQVVHLAAGGMLVLAAPEAVPIVGGSAVLDMASLQRLARVPGLALSLLAMPGNTGQGGARPLNEHMVFEARPGELWGTVLERQPDGSWLARPERYAGIPGGATGFVVMSEDEIARLSAPITTPVAPPPPPLPPLPAWVDRAEPLPGYHAQPSSPGIPGYEGVPPPTAEDLIIESRQRAQGAWLANPQLRDPNQIVGTSEGGPGEWGYSPTRSGGEGYQERVTGVPRGVEYRVNGVWFDGYDASRNVLLDAKDWVGYPPADQEFWHPGTLKEAFDQIDAVRGTNARIEWHVATPEAADALNRLFENDEQLSTIRIVVMPRR